MDAAYLFAKNFVNIHYADLPSDVVEATKKEVLDTLGVALAGMSEAGLKELIDIVIDWGGKGESTIFGCKQKVPAPSAAQVNATMVHALDFDDVDHNAVMHPGVVTIPTCLAMGERKGNLNGKEFITAIAIGVDMLCRLGLATQPGIPNMLTGWHFTTLYGYFGAAGVAGRILGLNEEQIVNAFGIAYHQCSGNAQSVKDGGLTKRLGPGFAVRGGITAALMAEKGMTGAKNSLEGEFGIFKQYHRGNYDAKALITDLGKQFRGTNVSIKPYPCCRGIHPSIDAALALVNQHNIKPEEVQEVTISVGEGFHSFLCVPQEVKCRPRNPVDAQFSIPWGVAAAIARRHATMEDFTGAAIRSQDILEVASKIRAEMDPTLSRSQEIEPARVKLTTKQGRVYTEQVDIPLGSPERPMSFSDCARKFRDCASYPAKKLSGGRIERVIELIEKLEQVKDIREIIGLMS